VQEDRLWIADPKAINHILQKSGYLYAKPGEVQERLALAVGHGIIWAQGESLIMMSTIFLSACLTIPQAMCISVIGGRWSQRSVSPRPRVSYRVSWILPTRHANFVCIRPRILGADLGPYHQMADKWNSIVENSESRDSAIIDVNAWMGKATLDACVLALVLGVCTGHGLTMNSSLKRIGVGAFGYDFGALDDANNPLTKSYMDLMCGHLSL